MFSPHDHAYKTCTTHSHRNARTAHKYTHMLPHIHYTQQPVNSNAAILTISYTVSSQQTYCVRSSTYNVSVKVEYLAKECLLLTMSLFMIFCFCLCYFWASLSLCTLLLIEAEAEFSIYQQHAYIIRYSNFIVCVLSTVTTELIILCVYCRVVGPHCTMLPDMVTSTFAGS